MFAKKKPPPDFQDILKSMFTTAYSILGNQADAEDAVQDMAMKYLNKRPKVKETLRGYLLRMVYYHCIDLLRKKKILISLELVAEPVAENVMDDQAFPLEEGLIELAPTDRLVLDLFYRENMSLEEIASVMDASSGAIKVKLHRARQRLRKIFIQKGVHYERV